MFNLPTTGKRCSLVLLLVVVAGTVCFKGNARTSRLQQIAATNSSTVLFDFDWRFQRGGAQSAEANDFDDSKWRKLDLPHDWSIEDLPNTDSPFDRTAISQVNGGFTSGGTGWYRKTFTISNTQKGKRILVQFDGIYMNAEVWLNGKWVGTHPYGYTSFWFDLTDKIKFDAPNILAVKVRNEGENSRWYSGSGIYRHVWLKILDDTHIAPWGVYITTPEVKNYWGGSSNATTHLLGAMHYLGMLRVVRREKGIRIYQSRHHESNKKKATELCGFMDALADVVVGIYGPLPAKSLAFYIRRLRYAAPQWKDEVKNTLARAKARLAHASVEGVEWYWNNDERPDLVQETEDRVRLLAPFDPLVHDRWRFEMLWGWTYRFEAYTPVPKRKLGYYAMPLLWRDRVIGWGNVSQKNGALDAKIGYVQSPPRERIFKLELDAELERIQQFLNPIRRGSVQ